MLGAHTNTTHPDLVNAMEGCFKASRCLKWWCNRPRKGLEIVTPFHSLKMPEGADRKKYGLVMSFVRSVTGNCHLIMKDPIKAAEWYRRAAQYHKDGRYVPIYAKTVLRHNLVDHYQAALECVEASNANWSRLPFLFKLFSHAWWGWQLHPRLWRLPFFERGLSRRLQDRINSERTS